MSASYIFEAAAKKFFFFSFRECSVLPILRIGVLRSSPRLMAGSGFSCLLAFYYTNFTIPCDSWETDMNFFINLLHVKWKLVPSKPSCSTCPEMDKFFIRWKSRTCYERFYQVNGCSWHFHVSRIQDSRTSNQSGVGSWEPSMKALRRPNFRPKQHQNPSTSMKQISFRRKTQKFEVITVLNC